MKIREADVESERDRLAAFMRRYLKAHCCEGHYEWLYLLSPHGRARAWVATDDAGDELIGVAAAFPRRIRVGRETLTCWNLGDFAIAESHRALGPAIRLQRACLEEVLAGKVPFAYDHPSRSMMAIYERMGFESAGQVVRMARPMRVDDRVERLLPDGIVARAVRGLGNLLLSFPVRRSAAAGEYETRLLDRRFDRRFSELDESVNVGRSVVGVRSADHLNWRYLDNRLFSYEALTVTNENGLQGYAVFHEEAGFLTLADLFADPTGDAAQALIAAIVEIGRDRGAQGLHAPVLDCGPVAPLLMRWGFRVREHTPFVVSTRKDGPWDGVVTPADQWFLTDGDRDV